MPLRIHLYRNLALCFSNNHQSSLHAHQALQMTVALDGPFDLEIEEDGRQDRTPEAQFACIAPQKMHQIGARTSTLAYLYLDTNPVAYTKWRAAGGTPIPPDASILAALRDLVRDRNADRDTVEALAYRWCEHSLPGLLAVGPSDPRIARALDIIDHDLLQALNYAGLARQVHLSPSRFANLFREQTGLPVRNYVLWRRLVHVFERLEHGDSITSAAHNAGFSDCAHLSRSFHRICGAKPSDMNVVQLSGH
ncbi:MAG: helix-turn-helix transcriptional regulator [Lysobacter sp.]|nr:helix-turn-helix transcriptional regulator [Lysobacter sp.]